MMSGKMCELRGEEELRLGCLLYLVGQGRTMTMVHGHSETKGYAVAVVQIKESINYEGLRIGERYESLSWRIQDTKACRDAPCRLLFLGLGWSLLLEPPRIHKLASTAFRARHPLYHPLPVLSNTANTFETFVEPAQSSSRVGLVLHCALVCPEVRIPHWMICSVSR